MSMKPDIGGILKALDWNRLGFRGVVHGSNGLGKGTCQQVVIRDPDVTRLPYPRHGQKMEDHMTLPLVVTVDPDAGVHNMGMYRSRVFSPKKAHCTQAWGRP